MNISEKILTDLEVYNKIIPKIDFTITSFGTEQLKSMVKTYFADEELLKRRRIINNIIHKPKDTKKKIKSLNDIKKLEYSLNWFYKDLDDTEYKDLYFSNDMFNIKELLSITNFMKIYSPTFIFVIYFIIYLILRYMRIPVDLKQYFYGIYQSYQMMVTGILLFFTHNMNMISLLSNLFSTLYIFYQLYVSYSSIETSVTHYKKCRSFRTYFNDLKTFVDCTINILKKDMNIVKIYNPHKEKLLWDSINLIKDKLNDSNLKSIGYTLLLKKEFQELKPMFDIITDYIGMVDAYINISRLVTDGGWAFPIFDFNSNKPYIEAKELWSLYTNNRWEQVTNDCKLGLDSPRTMILTGPNTSGKSTYIRNIMLTVLLSQTLGIAPCKSIQLTPFYNLFTYLDIPNIARNRESLFEAEIHRCLEFCKIIENIPDKQFSFTVMDELFTGTNPKEGIASSYAVCEYLGQFDNSIMIVTTHFHKLTELEDVYKDKFINKKFFVYKDMNGSFLRPYKIEDGVSDQNIAIELLRNKGYNSLIIDRASQLIQ